MKKYWFAGISIAIACVLLVVSGFDSLAWIGLLCCLGGAFDFLFLRGSIEGYLASEAYGEAGESLWEFRSFIFMVGGPMLSLYAVLFA